MRNDRPAAVAATFTLEQKSRSPESIITLPGLEFTWTLMLFFFQFHFS